MLLINKKDSVIVLCGPTNGPGHVVDSPAGLALVVFNCRRRIVAFQCLDFLLAIIPRTRSQQAAINDTARLSALLDHV